MKFQDKRVLVTGAASGIGHEAARLFVEAGARVVAADITREGLDALASTLGDAIIPHVVDLSQQHECEAMIATAVAALGGLDVLINNAGIGSFGRATDLEPTEWRRVMAVNLDAVFYSCRTALPHLIDSKGNIVCTASVSGVGADYGIAAYNSAKAGLLGLMRNLAVDYAAMGVRVNAVSPGFTETRMTSLAPPPVRAAFEASVPMKRAGRAEEIADAILVLASDRASYITGQNLVVDGGLLATTGQPNNFEIIAKMMAGTP